MIALFALLIIVTCFSLVAAWLADNPGMVVMHWFGYQIETSAAVLLAFALIAAIVASIAWGTLQKLFLAPSRFMERRSLKQYRAALSEITHSVAALAANDMSTASTHTHKAEKLLGTTPLTLLLRAQISKSEGSDDETRKLLEQLLDHPETEYLAAKSLSDAARKQQLLPQATKLAERANKVNPKESHGAWAVFDLHLAAGHFQEAEIHAQTARKKGAFSRADVKTALGRIALKQAENSLANGNKEHAVAFAKKAKKLLKEDEHAAEFYTNLKA